jgi:hypothetical protein
MPPFAPDTEAPALPTALAEWEIYADHRAALDATLFAPAGPDLVLELCEGQLAAPGTATE